MPAKFDGWRCNYLIGEDKKSVNNNQFYGHPDYNQKACSIGAILNTFDYDYSTNGSFRYESYPPWDEMPDKPHQYSAWRHVKIKGEPRVTQSSQPNGVALPSLPTQQGWCVPNNWVESNAMVHTADGNEWTSTHTDNNRPIYFNTSKFYKDQADPSQVYPKSNLDPSYNMVTNIEWNSKEDIGRVDQGTLTNAQFEEFRSQQGNYAAIFPAGETNGRSLYYDVKNCERQDNMYRCNHTPHCSWSGKPVCKANFDHVHQKHTKSKGLIGKDAELISLVNAANSTECGQRSWIEDTLQNKNNCRTTNDAVKKKTSDSARAYMDIVEEMHNNHNFCRNKNMRDCQRDERCEVAGSYYIKGPYIDALKHMRDQESRGISTHLHTEGNDTLSDNGVSGGLMGFSSKINLKCDWWQQSSTAAENHHLGIDRQCHEESSPFSCWNMLQTRLFKQMNVATRVYHNKDGDTWERQDQKLGDTTDPNISLGSHDGGTTRLTNYEWLNGVSAGGSQEKLHPEWDYWNNGGTSYWMPGHQQETLKYNGYWSNNSVISNMNYNNNILFSNPNGNPFIARNGEFQIPTGMSRPDGFPKNLAMPTGTLRDGSAIGSETFTQSFHLASSFPYYNEKTVFNDRHQLYHKVGYDQLSMPKTISDGQAFNGKGFAPFLMEFNKNPMDPKFGIFSNTQVDMIGAGLPFPPKFWIGTQKPRQGTDTDDQKYMGLRTCTNYWGDIYNKFNDARALKQVTSDDDDFYDPVKGVIYTDILYNETLFHTPKGWFGSNKMVVNDFEFIDVLTGSWANDYASSKNNKQRTIDGYRANWTNPNKTTDSKETSSINLEVLSEEHTNSSVPGTSDWMMSYMNSYSSGAGQAYDYRNMDQNYTQRIGSYVRIR